jgi:hypothetical protein
MVDHDTYPPTIVAILPTIDEDLLIWAKDYRLPLPPDVQRIRDQYEVEQGWRRPNGDGQSIFDGKFHVGA